MAITRKHLNPMAEDLAIDLTYIRRTNSKKAEEGFWLAIETVVSGLRRSNPNVSRDRFIGAIKAEAERIAEDLAKPLPVGTI